MEDSLKIIIKPETQKVSKDWFPINPQKDNNGLIKKRRQTLSISNSKPSKNFLMSNNPQRAESRRRRDEDKITLQVLFNFLRKKIRKIKGKIFCN